MRRDLRGAANQTLTRLATIAARVAGLRTEDALASGPALRYTAPMPSSFTQNYYHAVFGTRQRYPWITEEIHERLYSFMGGIVRDLRAQLIAGNGMQDHVHLLVRFPPDLAPAVLTREVKSRSSRWIHEVFPGLRDFAWQRGYGGFTVSRSAVGDVERYIRSQQTHHAHMTFQQEFLGLLKKTWNRI